MHSTRTLLRAIALVGLIGCSTAGHAAIVFYSSLSAFEAATAARGTDAFDGFSTSGQTASPITRTAGTYGYTASTPGSFFGAGNTTDPAALSTNTATDSILFSAFTGGVEAAGANFFGSDIAGAFKLGSITVEVTDEDGTVSRLISDASQDSFLGFVSDGALTSFKVTAVQPPDSGFMWPTVDNLVLAKSDESTPVPEPASLALMGAALVGAFAARRRRVPAPI